MHPYPIGALSIRYSQSKIPHKPRARRCANRSLKPARSRRLQSPSTDVRSILFCRNRVSRCRGEGCGDLAPLTELDVNLSPVRLRGDRCRTVYH